MFWPVIGQVPSGADGSTAAGAGNKTAKKEAKAAEKKAQKKAGKK